MTGSRSVCAQPCVCHPDDFPCHHHFQTDNKQPYRHTIKLPDGRSGQIRFPGVSQLSGSVPRARNKQSGVFRCAAPGHPEQDKTQHMGCRLDVKATMTTIYGLRRPLRAGASEGDPELPFSGSGRMRKQRSRRREKAFGVFRGGWCVIRKNDAQIPN